MLIIYSSQEFSFQKPSNRDFDNVIILSNILNQNAYDGLFLSFNCCFRIFQVLQKSRRKN